MYYIYTKTDEPMSAGNIFHKKINMKPDEFDRKNPAKIEEGEVVLAHANNEKTMLEKKRIILKNLER